MVIQKQNFAVRQNGSVKGGWATYEADTDSGLIKYSGQLHLRFPLGTHSIGPANYVVDPGFLLSANLQKIGDTISVGPTTLTVSTGGVGSASVDAAISVAGQPMSGFVNLDISGRYFKINFITATVKVPIIGTILVQADSATDLPTYKLPVWERFIAAVRKFFKR